MENKSKAKYQVGNKASHQITREKNEERSRELQKQKPKGEPQTNGSYKIRQLIIKIMEYIHIFVHPQKIKTAQQK